MSRAAIILTHNRPVMLAQAVLAIGDQVDLIYVVDNASTPPVARRALGMVTTTKLVVRRIEDQPPNLSRFWNVALDELRELAAPRWVAFLCDDSLTPAGWTDAVIAAMVATGAAAGCSNAWGHGRPGAVLHVKTAPDRDIMGRMVGWAFILDTTYGLRADERLHWWWCDTKLDFDARRAGGMVMIGGYPVANQRPGEYTNIPELGERAGKDGVAFAEIEGFRPW